ncbi:MAG: serine/threonine-protein kinase [Myxococcota bacterium]|nr:serine/threonine-protein kinase [Myxococcota bacterium]
MSDSDYEEQTVAVTAHVDSRQTTIKDEQEASTPKEVATDRDLQSLDSTVDTGESPPRYPSSLNTLDGNHIPANTPTKEIYDSVFDTTAVSQEASRRLDFDYASDSSEIEDLTGRTLGGYKLESLLDAGGMSQVFLAKHESLNRKAAIKVLSSSLIRDETHKSRFLQEAQIVNEVTHPNIVQIFDFVESANPPQLALVMEYLEGTSLAHALSSGHRFSEEQALRICFQVCDAIATVHSRGIIHRDLKPGNIFLIAGLSSSFEYVPSIKVLDFGIAKTLVGPERHATKTGITMGTPAYMAPEQIIGSGPTEKSDVFAISSILYELLTGQRLFRGEMKSITEQKLINDTINLEALSSLKFADKIHNLVQRGLIREPKSRPTAIEFTRELTEIEPSMFENMRLSQMSYVNQSIPQSTSRNLAPDVPRNQGFLDAFKEESATSNKKPNKVAQYLMAFAITAATIMTSAWMLPRRGLDPNATQATPITTVKPVEVRRLNFAPLTPKSVQQIVKSAPPGATVTNLQTGEKLGRTPAVIELKTGASLKVAISLKGFREERITIESTEEPSTVKLKKLLGIKANSTKETPNSPAETKGSNPKSTKNKKPYRRGELPGF